MTVCLGVFVRVVVFEFMWCACELCVCLHLRGRSHHIVRVCFCRVCIMSCVRLCVVVCACVCKSMVKEVHYKPCNKSTSQNGLSFWSSSFGTPAKSMKGSTPCHSKRCQHTFHDVTMRSKFAEKSSILLVNRNPNASPVVQQAIKARKIRHECLLHFHSQLSTLRELTSTTQNPRRQWIKKSSKNVKPIEPNAHNLKC